MGAIYLFYHHSQQSYRIKRYPLQAVKVAWLDQELVALATDELLNNIIEMDEFNPTIKWIDAIAELVHQKKIEYGVHYGYAETNGEKGQIHLGLRMGRIDRIYKKEYPDMASITRQMIEALLQDKLHATRQKRMCFTHRKYSEEHRSLGTRSENWIGIKISEATAIAADKDLWDKLKEAFPEQS